MISSAGKAFPCGYCAGMGYRDYPSNQEPCPAKRGEYERIDAPAS